MARIPEDDDTLDSYEVEGLVSSQVSSSRSSNSKKRVLKQHRKVKKLPTSPREVVHCCCKKGMIKCWIAILVLLGIGMIVYTNDDINSAAKKIIHSASGDKSDDWNSTDDDFLLSDAIKKHMENNEPKNDPVKKDELDEDTDDYKTDEDNNEGVDDEDNEDNKSPDESNETTDENDKSPDETNETPDETNETPDETNETPDETNETPDETNENPDEANENPDEINQDGTAVEGDDEEYSDDYTQNVVIAEETEEEKEERVKALIEEWGNWHFWDGAAETRPTEDYLSMYPNKDCPYEGFPDESWQADAVYVNHMIDSALELVDRAKDAIFTEYGFGPKYSLTSEQRSIKTKLFKLGIVDFDSDTATKKINEGLNRGGWTTKKSFHGLSRRLIHAMMTNDKFTVVMAGNSAAAGLGNNFLQSYMAQFDYLFRPILERLGVELVTRNLANGDIGTMSNALGSGSVLGDNIDMIIWDSDLVNGYDNEASVDLFFRQALLAGNRPPVLVGSPDTINVLKDLHQNANAEIFVLGSGMGLMPQTTDEEQAKTLPQALRYLNCTESMQESCEEHKFNAKCWIDRDDVEPVTKQLHKPRDQGREHPGFRQHRLKSRVLFYLMLEMVADALTEWGDITIVEGNPLDGAHWHITEHYDDIQSKIKSLDESIGSCASLKEYLPERICTTPLQARTELLPRADPALTSITSILDPSSDGSVPSLSQKMLYDGDDVPNPVLMIPADEVNVHDIIINRRRELFGWQEGHDYTLEPLEDTVVDQSISTTTPYLRRRTDDNDFSTGSGWELQTLPGNCDGTPSGICGRLPSSDCLIYGHMNYQGGLVGNDSNGWLVMNLSNVTEGIVMIQFEPLISSTLPEDFSFEYVVDDDHALLKKEQFLEKTVSPQKKVELITLLDDPGFIESDDNGNKAKNIKFAFRVKNCENECSLKLTHVYWA